MFDVKNAIDKGYKPIPINMLAGGSLVPWHYQDRNGVYGYTDTDLYKNRSIFGIVLLDVVLIDVDAHKPGADLAPIKSDLCELLDVDLEGLEDLVFQDNLSNNSIHYLVKLPKDIDFTTILQSNHSKLIDFVDFKVGRQIVHVRSTKRQFWRHVDDLHVLTCDQVYKIFDRKNIDLSNNDDFDRLVSASQNSRSDIDRMLKNCDPNCGYDDWFRIGMAIASWDNSDVGLSLWDDWSSGGSSYRSGECAIKWRSFGGGSISVGTLSHISREHSATTIAQHVQQLCSCISTADLVAMSTVIKDRISNFASNFDIGEIDRKLIAGAYSKRLKKLTGGSVSVADIMRELFTHAKPKRDGAWDHWLYILSLDAYYNLTDGTVYSSRAFDLACGHLVPKDPTSGGSLAASRFVAKEALIEIVHNVEYMPLIQDVIVELDQGYDVPRKCLNSFRPNSIPTGADRVSDGGLEYIKMLRSHLNLLCGSAKNGAILEQWIAHQAQRPGHKILWAPVVQSIQGVGKSYIAQLLKVILCDVNVKVISPDQVLSQFKGWAVDSAVNVLEELRVSGKNRQDAMNALKPLITDKKIQVADKFIKASERINTTNYICFTNFKNSLPVDSTDRRWWIVSSKIESLEDMYEFTGMAKSDYFNSLFDGLELYADEVVCYFRHLRLTDNFLDTKQAPLTAEKLAIEATEQSRVLGLRQVKGMIDDDSIDFATRGSIDFARVRLELASRFDGVNLSDDNVIRIASHLGFQKSQGDNDLWLRHAN